ncbi:GNAT family N-acetyltransferase [Amantichitinum ursilacus]|uniref:Mycothiol acetyltransferase n=1 Tax=Amantichitinum ursilacus TaxID=857265 RepID=A0A0N0XM67_9NEIS|nr:GNAT family N-acetyltransferase [Amantichitinum ursilacus]KPC54764.1 Mycothiol acetyltransferase [Amantichitinum ursilacus]
MSYTVLLETPSPEAYRSLREQCGLSAKSAQAAARGLPNGLFAVQILHHGAPVGMGRVIGDGGCFYQVVDICVLPQHQGRGLGKVIMAQIMHYLRDHAPVSAYVSLLADGEAHRLYAQFGFAPTAPRSVGMFWKPPAA